jgi:hypothetical protein
MRPLPNDFLAELARLPGAYLCHSDPIRQSGFGGGAERWQAERQPTLDAVNRSGTFIDIGCANGYLRGCGNLRDDSILSIPSTTTCRSHTWLTACVSSSGMWLLQVDG